jgi:hypothetical protein
MKRRPKPVSDDVLALRKAYRDAHPRCEYSLATGPDFDFNVWAGLGSLHLTNKTTEIDHIWGRNGKSDDVELSSNYMAANAIPHVWKTDNDVPGRILALWWKWQDRERTPEDWDPDRMSRVFGQQVLGWLENKLDRVDLPTWVRTRGEEVLGGQ